MEPHYFLRRHRFAITQEVTHENGDVSLNSKEIGESEWLDIQLMCNSLDYATCVKLGDCERLRQKFLSYAFHAHK